MRYIFQLNAYKNDSSYIFNMAAMVNNTLEAVPDRLHLFEIGNEEDTAVSNHFGPPDGTSGAILRNGVIEAEV